MEQIKMRQVGLNLLLSIGKENLTKKVEDKEERERIKALVASYDKKPTKKLEQEIRKSFTANTEIKKTAELVEKKVAKKVGKQQQAAAKSTVKKVKEVSKEIAQAKEITLLEKENLALRKKLEGYEKKPMPVAAPDKPRARG